MKRSVGWAGYGDFGDSERWPGYRHTVERSIHVRGDLVLMPRFVAERR